MHLLPPPPTNSFPPRTTGSSGQRAHVPPAPAMTTTQELRFENPTSNRLSSGLWHGSSFAGGKHGSAVAPTSLNDRAHPEAAQPPVLPCVPTAAGTSVIQDTRFWSERLSSHNLPG